MRSRTVELVLWWRWGGRSGVEWWQGIGNRNLDEMKKLGEENWKD